VIAGQVLAAASGAATSPRTTTAGFHFDPSTTLGWAVPLIVLAPLAAFVVAVSSVRTRRASANTAMLGAVISLLATILVAWGLTRKATFTASYVYLTSNVAFSGPANFQNFEIDIVLHVDHLAVVALLLVEIGVIGVLGWHRVMGRNEPGPARFQSVASVFLWACAMTLMTTDLAELFAFWGLAGVATYLLLSSRWGADEPSLGARVALALPFLTDLSLLCGIAVLYSRYGKQNLNDLIPILHTTAGWTVRQLVVASVLLFAGVAGRLALWPLHVWLTSTASTSAPAASALSQAVWSVVGITVLYRLLPIFVASNQQTMHALVIACGVAAIAAPLLSLIRNDPRRALVLVASGVTALGTAVVIHGFQYPGFTFAIVGVACVFAAAPARAAAMLAASAVSGAMRTDDMREMGDAWRRMRASSVILLTASLVLGLSAAAALVFAVDSRSRFGIALGEALFLVSLGSLRVFMGVATGPLRRRRAFEPDRVREAPPASLSWPYWLALAGLVLAGASFVSSWLGLLDTGKHHTPAAGAYAVWLAVAVLGFAAAAFVYARGKDGALLASAWLGMRAGALLATGEALLDRFILGPGFGIVDRTGEWIPAGDGALGRAAFHSGRLAATAARGPALTLLLAVAVLLGLAVALVSPGVFR
jgi:NADH:ubiquinone oxidoreductase subunit 5 (subunit L)/multisubunit Na+/H+ antiporter MnhA subunit